MFHRYFSGLNPINQGTKIIARIPAPHFKIDMKISVGKYVTIQIRNNTNVINIKRNKNPLIQSLINCKAEYFVMSKFLLVVNMEKY